MDCLTQARLDTATQSMVPGSGSFPDRTVRGQRPDGESPSLSRGRTVLAGPPRKRTSRGPPGRLPVPRTAADRVLLVFYSASRTGCREPSDKAGKMTKGKGKKKETNEGRASNHVRPMWIPRWRGEGKHRITCRLVRPSFMSACTRWVRRVG